MGEGLLGKREPAQIVKLGPKGHRWCRGNPCSWRNWGCTLSAQHRDRGGDPRPGLWGFLSGGVNSLTGCPGPQRAGLLPCA